jgi:hypothetical protein
VDEIDIIRNRLKAYFRMFALHAPMLGNELVDVLDAYLDAKFKREWQGLTDEEKLTIVRETDNPVDALAATEAKLKENNCVVLSKECYERGCAAYDDRVDEGVMVPRERNSD